MIFDPKKIQVYSAADVIDLPEPKELFLLKPRILPRGGKMVFGGCTKVGKTFMILNLIRALIAGERLFDAPEWEVQESRVLLLEKEVGPWSLGARIAKVCEALPNTCLREKFMILSQPPNFYLSSPDCVTWLKEYCTNAGIDVLLLDPINKMHFWNENDASQALGLIDVMQRIQEDKIGIVYSHHFKKPPRGQNLENYDALDLYNFRGSARHVEDADAILTVDRVPGRLVAGWDSWAIDAKLILRHGPSPEDVFSLYFNEHNDMRVRFRGIKVNDNEPKRKLKPVSEQKMYIV